MKRINIFLLGLCCLIGLKASWAQELKCDVRVNANQVAGTDKTVYDNLQTALYEFLNNTKFTDINFKQNEKIECSILLNIKERTGTENFAADINIALRRPVYKSSYNTPLFNYIDTKFNFEYMDGQPLDFNTNSFISELTGTIGYYVYLMLGLDFDSFSLNGGTAFFETAQNIAMMAPQNSANQAGWSTTGRQNRYALIKDIFICPNTNPDGTYYAGNHTVEGSRRGNANNVDLNRNYRDFDKGPHPDGEWCYQDETRWLMDLAQDYKFTMAANFHTGSEVVNYPWDTHPSLHADDAWWKLVCHEYADQCHELNPDYMNMPHQYAENGIINGYLWYTISGSFTPPPCMATRPQDGSSCSVSSTTCCWRTLMSLRCRT